MNHPHWRLCVLFLLSAAAGHARDLYRLSSLEGLSVIHTYFGKRVNESGTLSASPDKIASEITISIEKEGDAPKMKKGAEPGARTNVRARARPWLIVDVRPLARTQGTHENTIDS